MKNYNDKQKQLVVDLIKSYQPGSLRGLDYDTIKGHFSRVRNLFYRSDHSEWELKKCHAFVIEYNIPPEQFINIIKELFEIQFPNFGIQNGRKSALEFLKRLENSPRFKNPSTSKPRIKSLDNDGYIKLLNDLRTFKEIYLPDISHNQWLEIIKNNFETGKASSTFRKDYFEYRNRS